jgi:REP element-mobilizing transposase RayT
MFVTFRLHGSLPRGRSFRPDILTSNGDAFAAMDRLLGFQRYRLDAYVVMPNHVHMLATPSVPSPSWLGPLKGFTAHKANRILGTAGSRFWQDESYDHLVGDGEFERIRRYIEWNPVRAGLAANPEEFPWCSAAKSDAA